MTQATRNNAPLERYAYVSVFGLRNIEALKTAIVQSTVRLNAAHLGPTVASFFENVGSVAGVTNLAEQGIRRGSRFLGKAAAAIPHADKVADLAASGAALFIRNQIICIDDIERSGQGLDVADILGLVSSLRERKGCKVVLLLNEEGLGDAKSTFREYLEKVVDQAIRFEPTAEESAAAALNHADSHFRALSGRTVALGITNIRVIRRIRRFLSFLEPDLADLHPGVTERVVQSIALLGWSVFEPKLAPKLDHIKQYNRFAKMASKAKRSDEELKTDTVLYAYDFAQFEEIDAVILRGLQTGGFDATTLKKELVGLDERLAKDDVRSMIEQPWRMYRNSFDDDATDFVDALVSSVEIHAAAMYPAEASNVLGMLRELGKEDEATRLVSIYVDAQKARPREFFEANRQGSFGRIDRAIQDAFDERLAEMPLQRDPVEVLLSINRTQGWSPEDTSFLASMSINDYYVMLKKTRGSDLHIVIPTALQFGKFEGADEQDKTILRSMTAALRRVGAEGSLNAMRVKPYLGDGPDVEEAAGSEST